MNVARRSSGQDGARTFLSAAVRSLMGVGEILSAVEHSGVAADKNVRAPVMSASAPANEFGSPSLTFIIQAHRFIQFIGKIGQRGIDSIPVRDERSGKRIIQK